MPSLKDRRQQRQTRAVVNAMRPLTEREEAAVLLAIAQCATDLQDNRPAEASARAAVRFDPGMEARW